MLLSFLQNFLYVILILSPPLYKVVINARFRMPVGAR